LIYSDFITTTGDIASLPEYIKTLVGKPLFYIISANESRFSDKFDNQFYKISRENGFELLETSYDNWSDLQAVFEGYTSGDQTVTISDKYATILSKMGYLKNLNIKVNGEVVDSHGIYSNKLYCENGTYIDGYKLPEDDVSGKFASTEWVTNKLSNQSTDIKAYNDLYYPYDSVDADNLKLWLNNIDEGNLI
jgi:hypothetical protein